MTTTITIALIITNAACLIALACAIEGIGYWKQEAIVTQALKEDCALKDKWIARLEKDVDSRQQAINEWRMVANVLREEARERAQEAAYWRARKRLIYAALWQRHQKRLGRVTLARMVAL